MAPTAAVLFKMHKQFDHIRIRFCCNNDIIHHIASSQPFYQLNNAVVGISATQWHQ